MQGQAAAVLTGRAMVDALHHGALFDPVSQEAVQRTLRLACGGLNAPVAILSISDGGRQVLRGHVRAGQSGLPSDVKAYDRMLHASHACEPHVRRDTVVGRAADQHDETKCVVAATPLRLDGGLGDIGTLAIVTIDGWSDEARALNCLRELAAGLIDQLVLRAENMALRQRQTNLELQKQVFGQIAEGAPLKNILGSLASFVEHQAEGTLCVIHLVGSDGRLHVEAAPTMPESLLVEIDGQSPGANGSVGARAVFAGEAVMTPDLESAAETKCRAEMRNQGIRSAWSFPITSGGTVFGTIDMYRMHEGDPEGEHLHLISMACSAARIAIDRRRAEMDLRASEIYHRALIENSSEYILVLDAAGGTRYVSRRFAQAVGRDLGELDCLRDVVLQEDHCLLDELLRSLREAGEREFELRIVSGDGTVRHILGTGTDLLDNAAVRGLVINARDVTQQKLAIAAVSDSEERYRLVARASNDLIWDWDVAAGSLVWPARDENRFGYESADLPDRHSAWEGLVHPDDLDRVARGLERALAHPEEATWSDEYRFLHRDGSYATVLDRGFIVRSGSGEAVRVIGSMMDLTSRRMLEEQLRQAQRMEAIGRLAGGVAHDFNNLLTVIEGFTTMLLEELGSEGDQGMALLEIQKASARATALTRQLLAFSRRQVLQPRLLDVNQVLRGVSGMLRRLIPADIALETHLAPGEQLVHADVGQLEQVLLNLVINARESIAQGGTVTVRSDSITLPGLGTDRVHGGPPAGDYIRLSVEDNGCGMPPEVVDHVFEPFFTTKESGTGLGLATVYGIVEQSGGHVDVHSEVGTGTRFDVYLPRSQPAATAVSIPDAPEPITPTGCETILLVEDDRAVRGLTHRLLSRQGYQVFAADDGPTALSMLTRGVVIPDLLLTDVVLPHMSGPIVAERVLDIKPDTALVFMSGYTDEHLGQHGVLGEEVAFLQKPFQNARLLTLIREQLDARAAALPPQSAVGDEATVVAPCL